MDFYTDAHTASLHCSSVSFCYIMSSMQDISARSETGTIVAAAPKAVSVLTVALLEAGMLPDLPSSAAVQVFA
jgi:hypothetical protein